MTTTHVVHFSAVHKLNDIRIFEKESQSLAKAGYRVTLIARGQSSDVKSGVTRLAVSRTAPGGRLGRMIFGTAAVTVLALKQDADVYHFHGPELLPYGLLLKLLRKTVIYDAHENFRHQILQKEYLPQWLRSPIARIVGGVEDFAKGRFDGVVAATPRIAQQLDTPHTVTVTNYPIIENVDPAQSEPTTTSGTLIYVGGVSVIRGIKEMVQAVEIVNRTLPSRLIICGPIGSSLMEELKPLAGWKFVDALGWVERTEVLANMARSEVGLCVLHPAPNHVESIPNKLFEYMETGLPVVASDFPYWKQFVDDIGAGIMVDPLDPQAIANGILEIITNPERAANMSIAGASAVRDRFNWDAEAEKLVLLYQRILRTNG